MQPATTQPSAPAFTAAATLTATADVKVPPQPPADSVFAPELHSLFLCHNPIDMRLGFDGVLARVIHWFGCARPHCAYAFINARGNRIKLLIHDGVSVHPPSHAPPTLIASDPISPSGKALAP